MGIWHEAKGVFRKYVLPLQGEVTIGGKPCGLIPFAPEAPFGQQIKSSMAGYKCTWDDLILVLHVYKVVFFVSKLLLPT